MHGLLGELTAGPVHIGSPFSLGVEINKYILWQDDLDSMRVALDGSDYVKPGVQVYQSAGVINPFIVVDGQSGREYGSSLDLRNAVLSVIQTLGYPLNLGTVRFEALTYDPATGATQTTRTDTPTGSGGPASGPGIFDQISAGLGVDRTTTQLLVIGGLVVAGILILKR